MLDTSRHFLPLEVIKRTIRGMFLTKLNVLHWHITDHESFPPVMSGVEDLSKYGAYSWDSLTPNLSIQTLRLKALKPSLS